MKLGSETGSSTEPGGDSGWLEDEGGGGSGGGEPEDERISDVGAHLMNWKCFFGPLKSDPESRKPVEEKAPS